MKVSPICADSVALAFCKPASRHGRRAIARFGYPVDVHSQRRRGD